MTDQSLTIPPTVMALAAEAGDCSEASPPSLQEQATVIMSATSKALLTAAFCAYDLFPPAETLTTATLMRRLLTMPLTAQ
ncbi:hypothetical protein CDD81_1474 [Ophiocordyceps australis]|uniref:Uncharacterized protein n=1 Tax=Ophiocordyceps australis TaxID=1399860 RepID=A0A2C5YAL6_9HYPO|nr:hypothetical protein CDD81_1474 [Ophiocordyceps australis]